MASQIIEKRKNDFEGAIGHFKSEVGSIRTGRATPSLVEDLKVEVYGNMMRLQELASISAPEPKTITIQPWDKSAMGPIERAISKSDLGIQPAVQGDLIRITLPSLTEERRKEFVKVIHQKSEEAKIKIRQVREESWNEIQISEKDGEIREDEKFRFKDELQKIVDEYNKKIEDISNKKEQEILTI